MNLGPPMAPGMGVEGSDPGNEGNWTGTRNGCYELTYFRFGLSIAQKWKQRAGKPLDERWAQVQKTLCYPQEREWRGSSVYFYTDESKELIGGSNTLGQVYACGHIPCESFGINATVMRNTLQSNNREFDWSVACERERLFPGTPALLRFLLSAHAADAAADAVTDPSDIADYAMAAARLGMPELAIELLFKNTTTNRFNSVNGHSQGVTGPGARWPCFTPSQGTLLYAVALMAGGWDGDGNVTAPGFPRTAAWHGVRAEGFPKVF